MRIVLHQNDYATPAKPTRVLVLHLVGVGDNRIGMGLSSTLIWAQEAAGVTGPYFRNPFSIPTNASVRPEECSLGLRRIKTALETENKPEAVRLYLRWSRDTEQAETGRCHQFFGDLMPHAEFQQHLVAALL